MRTDDWRGIERFPEGQRLVRRVPLGQSIASRLLPILSNYPASRNRPAAPAGIFTRTYDDLNQVHQLVWPTGSVLTWTYDAAGNRKTRKSSQGIVTYTYNGNSQLTRLVNEHDEVATFLYDAAGQEVQQQLANGSWSSLVYDPAGRTDSVSNFYPDNSILSRFAYTYDAAGNRTQEERENGSSRLWKYDATNQLISETRTEGTSWETLSVNQWAEMSLGGWDTLPVGAMPPSTTTFVYDSLGNRLVQNVDGELTTSTYDAGNRLESSQGPGGTTTYAYDADGNQHTVQTPAGGITTYSWNYENQLDRLAKPDGAVATYQYAPVTRLSDELRISKETASGTMNFIWDNQNIIQETDQAGSITAEYTLNPQPYGLLISQRRGGASSFYHYDALGSTQSLTDSSTVQQNTYRYSAFGELLLGTGTIINPFTWVGRLGYYMDDDSGLYILRRRPYSAQVGVFLSEDPLGYSIEIGSWYRYAGNSPVTYVDPSGLATVTLDVDAFIPWDWVRIPPDPRAIAKAVLFGAIPGLTQSYVKGDNRNPSPVPLRREKTRQFGSSHILVGG